MSEYYLASKVNYIIVAPATFFTVGFSRTRLKFYAHFLRNRKIDTLRRFFMTLITLMESSTSNIRLVLYIYVPKEQ